MTVHELNTRQTIHATRAQAWDFFSNPRNLARLTPAHLHFEILTRNLPERIHAGMMIAFRVRPLARIPLTWLTEITHVEEGSRFIDEQRAGPYAVWHHEHCLIDLGDGRTALEDKVTYVLPFAPLGDLVHRWLIRPQLTRIFAYREQAVCALFEPRAGG